MVLLDRSYSIYGVEEAMELKALEQKAREVRTGIIEAIHNAGSGHPGGSLSAAHIVSALYFHEMTVHPKDPEASFGQFT